MTMFRTLGLISLLAACGGGGGGGGDDDGVPTGTALPLLSPDGSFYTAGFTIATQTFQMDIDTGSTSTALADNKCTSCTGVTPLYTPGASATDTMHPASTMYADGSGWTGEVYSDTAGMGSGTPNVTVAFAGIEDNNMFFDTANSYQGILGLGPKELAEPNTSAFIEDLVAAGLPPFMGFEMCGGDGTMWLGGYDKASTSGAMQYTPMLPIDTIDNPFFAINISDVGFDGTGFGFAASTYTETITDSGQTFTFYPIVDTGTSFTYLPSKVFTKLLGLVNAHPMYGSLFTAPISASGDGCTTAMPGVTATMIDAMLPPMSLTFPGVDGTSFTITASAMQSYMFDAGGGDFCMSVGDDGGEGVVLGDTFMRGFVTVFDVDALQIGFATDKGCGASAKPRIAPLGHGRPLVEHGHGPSGFHAIRAQRRR